jgi:hypothetical protein
VNGFIEHLTSRLGTASNYKAIAYLHTLQSTTATSKPFPVCCVLTSLSLATASNSGDFSASRSQFLSSLTLIQNCLPAVPSTELGRHLFSASLAELNCTQHCQTKVKIKVTLRRTVSRPVCLGIKHPSGVYFCQTVAGLLMWDALSDERTGLSFARVTVSSNKSVVSTYSLHFTLRTSMDPH